MGCQNKGSMITGLRGAIRKRNCLVNALGAYASDQDLTLCARFTHPFHYLNAFLCGQQGCLTRRSADHVSTQRDPIQVLDVMENLGLVKIAFMIETSCKGWEDSLNFHIVRNGKGPPALPRQQARSLAKITGLQT
jgi:hypothetical protein